MLINSVDLDDQNEPHVTRHGVTTQEIYAVFEARPKPRRNKNACAGDYFVVAQGIRVNFLFYRPSTARPISAWRV